MMRDATFQRRLNQLASAKRRYLKELERCEDEYERRFGECPSDVDDDFWIDFAHTTGADVNIPTVKDVVDHALDCCRRMSRH